MKQTSAFYENTRMAKIRAGDIGRHPIHQRPSPGVDRFEKKLGKFEIGKCVELIHVVPNDKPGPKWLAVNGATRVEACIENKKFGPDTKLDCKIYGNGTSPTPKELDELYLLLNCDHISTGSEVKFVRSVGAQRPSAVFADHLLQKLGPRFKARSLIWKVVRLYDEEISEMAVDFALEIWPDDVKIPGVVIHALASIIEDPASYKKLVKRKNALRKTTPENIRLRAQTKMLGQVGRRDSVPVWTARVLLAQRSASL